MQKSIGHIILQTRNSGLKTRTAVNRAKMHVYPKNSFPWKSHLPPHSSTTPKILKMILLKESPLIESKLWKGVYDYWSGLIKLTQNPRRNALKSRAILRWKAKVSSFWRIKLFCGCWQSRFCFNGAFSGRNVFPLHQTFHVSSDTDRQSERIGKTKLRKIQAALFHVILCSASFLFCGPLAHKFLTKKSKTYSSLSGCNLCKHADEPNSQACVMVVANSLYTLILRAHDCHDCRGGSPPT